MDPLTSEKLHVACMKAVLLMDEAGLSQFNMIATAVAARILNHFHVPFMVVVGFCHVLDLPWSIPHVWLQTNEFITDLTFSRKTPEREFLIAGRAVGLCEGSFKASYDAAAKFPIIEGALSIELLHETSRDLAKFLAMSPVRDTAEFILAKALDDSTNTVELRGEAAAAILENARQAPAAS